MKNKSRANKIKNQVSPKDIKGQMWRNNLLGIIAIILLLIFLFDIGGVISSFTKLLTP